MAGYERILDEEDRIFTSSLGNWAGGAVWEDIGYPPYNGAAKFYLDELISSKSITLSYPNILIKKNGTYDLKFDYFNVLPPDLSRTTFRVTDGVYTYEDFIERPHYPDPEYPALHFVTPDDWNKEAASLIIIIEAIPPSISSMFCDNFTIYGDDPEPPEEAFTQYLPIIGMG